MTGCVPWISRMHTIQCLLPRNTADTSVSRGMARFTSSPACSTSNVHKVVAASKRLIVYLDNFLVMHQSKESGSTSEHDFSTNGVFGIHSKSGKVPFKANSADSVPGFCTRFNNDEVLPTRGENPRNQSDGNPE